MRLDDLISESSILKSKIDELVCPVKISRRAFEKVCLYSKLASEIVNSPIEIAGVLTAQRDSVNLVASDAFLFPEQTVSSFDGQFSETSIAQAYNLARLNNHKILGMWHSHGGHPAFHSEHDDEQLDVLYYHNQNVLKNSLLVGVEDVCCLTDLNNSFDEFNNSNSNLFFNASELSDKNLTSQHNSTQIILFNASKLNSQSSWSSDYFIELGFKSGTNRQNKLTKKFQKLFLELFVESNVKKFQHIPFAVSLVVNENTYAKTFLSGFNPCIGSDYYCELRVQQDFKNLFPRSIKNVTLELVDYDVSGPINSKNANEFPCADNYFSNYDLNLILDEICSNVVYGGKILGNYLRPGFLQEQRSNSIICRGD
ncbi:Mov34/MPN/PAD-1 family protein [Candidatus Woesearchaeota archaeon]|jgi:proteasome lid subunit RPN8/RPN11|nr:Mov34/MPN/PAD-1 family protein [Candidatus Woesearchaeota archaeon]